MMINHKITGYVKRKLKILSDAEILLQAVERLEYNELDSINNSLDLRHYSFFNQFRVLKLQRWIQEMFWFLPTDQWLCTRGVLEEKEFRTYEEWLEIRQFEINFMHSLVLQCSIEDSQ